MLNLLERLQDGEMTLRAQEAAREGLEAVCEEAKMLCPKDTGMLQASIHVRTSTDGGEVTADVPYAAVVEMGSAGRAAQPFLFPAFRAHQQEVISGVQRAVGRYLKER